MQRFFCVGNLTKDVEPNTTPNGISVAKFDIAVARRLKPDEADFFHIVAWRGQADNCIKYLHKGSKVAVVGEIHNRDYQASDGSKRFVSDVIADEVQFLTPKGEGKITPMPQQKKLAPAEDEQLPF